MHVHRVERHLFRNLLRFYESLPHDGGEDLVRTVIVFRKEEGVVAAMLKGTHHRLCQEKLLRVQDHGVFSRINAGDHQHFPGGAGPHHVAELHVLQHGEQIFRLKVPDPGRARKTVSAHAVPEKQQPVPGLPDGLDDQRAFRFLREKRLFHFLQKCLSRLRRLFEYDGPGLDYGLVLRLPEIQAPAVDILLDHRVDKVRDVPVQVDVLADPGGGDLLQACGQLQFHRLAGDVGHHLPVIPGVRILVSDSAEHDVVHGAGHLIRGILPVEGRVGDDVRPHHQIELPVREELLQPLQVLRIPGVHRQLAGEEVHVEFIRDAHVDDLTADEMGLSFL